MKTDLRDIYAVGDVVRWRGTKFLPELNANGDGTVTEVSKTTVRVEINSVSHLVNADDTWIGKEL